MIKFEFTKDYANKYINKKEEVLDKFNTYEMTGWKDKVILNDKIFTDTERRHIYIIKYFFR